MHERFFTSEPTRTLKAEHEGATVTASIWYAANSGPEESGFRAVPHVGHNPPVKGFPVMKVTLESSGHGYENNWGWLQLVEHIRPDRSVEDWSPDPFPMVRDRGIPFVTFGYLPTFYDAPFWPERPAIHWQADVFLAPIVREPTDEHIRPVLGFRWGFRIGNAGTEPELIPLEVLGADAWLNHLPHLRSWFPDWRFAERGSLKE
jgi:hypothetical protein